VALHKPPVVTLPIQTSACSNIRLDPQKSRCCKCCYFAKFRYGVPGTLKTLVNARSAEPHCWQTRPADLYQVAFIHRPVFRRGYPSSGHPRQWALRRHDSDVPIVRPGTRLRVGYPPGRPGYPAEGWVVFLNATWYQLVSRLCYIN